MPSTNSPSSGQPLNNDVRPVQIPDHTLLRQVGQGSYGEVWLALNSMGILRAVKIVRRGRLDRKSGFERELAGIKRFEPISRSHEGFVDILHVGINEAEGYFYYVMELGDDELLGPEIDPQSYSPKTLGTEIKRRGRLPPEECLQIGIALSSGLAALHKNELVHRDIKPSNIIFVGGIPKLADIGLVAEFSEAMSFVGTEGFIPPEGPGKAGADIFALGKVLYEAATGLDRNHFPSLPEKFEQAPDSELFWELNEVILQACQTEPSKRYGSALKMHDELLFLTNGKSVKRLRLLEKRFASLKRTGVAAALALLIAAAIAFPIYREWKYQWEVRQQKVGANLVNGNKAMNSGDLLGALPFFVEAFQLDKGNKKQITNHKFRIASILDESPKLTHCWSCPSNEVFWCEFSPDGRSLLVSSTGRQPLLYDLRTEEVKEFRASAEYLMMASFSSDGRYLVIADFAGSARVLEVSTGKVLSILPHPAIFRARFSPDGQRVATVGQDGYARVWNWRATNALVIHAQKQALQAVAFSPDGSEIATGANNGEVQIWDAASGRLLKGPMQHPAVVSCVSFSTDGQTLGTGCIDFKARVWDVQTGKVIKPELKHRDLVSGVQFSADGRFILTSSWDGTARIWRADTLQEIPINSVLHHPDRVTAAAFSPDCRLVATAGVDGSVRVWDLAGENVPQRTDPLQFSGDGLRSLSRHGDSLELWDSHTGKRVAGPFQPSGTIQRWGLNHDGSVVFSLSWVQGNNNTSNHLAQIWRASTKFIAPRELELKTTVSNLAVNLDGSFVATFGPGGGEWFDLRRGNRGSFPYARRIQRCVFSPRADTFAMLVGTDVDVYRLETEPRLLCRLPQITSAFAVDFSADGSLIATTCSDGGPTKCYAQVWEVATGKPVGPQLKHSDGVLSVMFSPDGKRLLTASEDFTSVVWDFRSGKALGSSMDHDRQAHKAVFSSDGMQVATVGADQVARVWDAASAMPLTPQIHFPMDLNDVHFCQGDRKLIVSFNSRNTWSFSLPDQAIPIADLGMMAGVLSSVSPAQVGHLRGQTRPNFLKEWTALKSKYPAQFQVSDDDITHWHRMQAEFSEADHQWASAIFHWNILIARSPGDEWARARLTADQKRLNPDGGSRKIVQR